MQDRGPGGQRPNFYNSIQNAIARYAGITPLGQNPSRTKPHALNVKNGQNPRYFIVTLILLYSRPTIRRVTGQILLNHL